MAIASVPAAAGPSTVIRLAPDRVCRDTVGALTELLTEARAGRIIGLGFVAVYKRREYIVDVTGELSRNPTRARGMIASLDDYLSEQPHK